MVSGAGNVSDKRVGMSIEDTDFWVIFLVVRLVSFGSETFFRVVFAVEATVGALVEEAAVKHAASKKAAQAGALIAGVSLIAGANSNRAFGTIASLAGTGAGVGVAVNSLNAMTDYKELVRTILNKCNEALIGVSQVVDKNRPEYLNFESSVTTILGIVRNNSIDQPKSNIVKSDVGKLLSMKATRADQMEVIKKVFVWTITLPIQTIKFIKQKIK